jgi:hypothetical protein
MEGTGLHVNTGLFFLSIVGTFVALSVLVAIYGWSWLRKMSKRDSLRMLALVSMFRFEGLSFLVPGVVSPMLSSVLAVPAAWGDFGAAVLAIAAVILLTNRSRIATWVVWLFNLWGTIDLLYAYYNGLRLDLDPGLLGATFFVVTLYVPILLVSHALIFAILLSRDRVPNK